MQRNLVVPATLGSAACAQFGDRDIATVDHLGRDDLRGLLTGKVMCARSNGTSPLNCNSPNPSPANSIATHCATTAFQVQEDCVKLNTRGMDVTQFADCCDPMFAVEFASEVAMQCSRAIISGMAVDGSLVFLDPMYWSPYGKDIQPSGISSLKPSEVEFDCFDFAGPSEFAFVQNGTRHLGPCRCAGAASRARRSAWRPFRP